ncbi:MAG: hypothetical protein WA376_07140 [Terrimicrobiaceae bacterium]
MAILTASFLCMNSALSHGIDGHVYRAENERNFSRDQHASPSGKSLTEPAIQPDGRWWGTSLSTGWTSREMHYGVDETGDYGAYTTNLSLRIRNLTISVWSGFGTGNEYQEWDFTLAYHLELGPLIFTPGYNFRYQPGIVEDDHDEPAQEGHDHTDEGHAEQDENAHQHESQHHEEGGHGHTGHSHNTYAHELFFLLGTTAVPYVTPGMLFVWDLANTPGVYMEFRLDGDIRIYRDVLSMQPYVLLGLNFGYNTRAYYGWNNFQFGLKATWKINQMVSIFGGISYSVAMTALKEINQGNEVWASTGVTLSY